MRIDIHRLTELRIPLDLVLNDVTAPILAKKLRKKGLQITDDQLRRLFREVRRYRKAHPEWVPVAVDPKGGEKIRIFF